MVSFDYQQYFPNSAIAKKFALHKKLSEQNGGTPLFQDFAKTWLGEMKIQWRASHYLTVDNVLSKHLIPAFTETEVASITKADILSFRASLANIPGHSGSGFSPTRINHIMTPLRMILKQAADRYDFNTPYRGIQPLKARKTKVLPFSLDEVWLILAGVRDDFKHYYTTRFFTGMRTSEIHGLRWKNVDLKWDY